MCVCMCFPWENCLFHRMFILCALAPQVGMFMYVCMYVWMYAWMYVFMCVSAMEEPLILQNVLLRAPDPQVSMLMYVCIYVCMYVFAMQNLFVPQNVHSVCARNAYIRTKLLHMDMCTCTLIYLLLNEHAHTHTHTHTHLYCTTRIPWRLGGL
jgi:hypothetical protein